MTIRTYREEFPVGARVIVRAEKSDGTDYDFNGRKGTVVQFYKCLALELDKPPKYGSNPVLISLHCWHHLNGELKP